MLVITICQLYNRPEPFVDSYERMKIIKNYIQRPKLKSYTVHPEERAFPLAFSILVYTDLERAIRLIHAIYRPQNYYCIHVDRKSPLDYSTLLKRATEPLGDNIMFVPDTLRLDVRWGTITNLEPEIVCSQILWNRSKSWKYLINSTGQEFPLRTNWELVKALKALNGTNIVVGTYKHRNETRIPTPSYLNLNITYYKGSVHVAVRREFIEFMLFDPRSIQLLEALKQFERDTQSPKHIDETYFATLNHNPHVFPIPGAFLGEHEYSALKNFVIVALWVNSSKQCESRVAMRDVCMLGLGDLPQLKTYPHFFANKFRPDVEPQAYDLLEQWIDSKVRFETKYHRLHTSFNISAYSSQEMAWHHL